MTKYIYILALAAFFFVPSALAQTVTRNLVLTLDTNKIDVIKYYIAKRDADTLTVDETDITNSAGLDFLQAKLNVLIMKIQQDAIALAFEDERLDIIPAAIVSGMATRDAAIATQDSLETGSAGVN